MYWFTIAQRTRTYVRIYVKMYRNMMDGWMDGWMNKVYTRLDRPRRAAGTASHKLLGLPPVGMAVSQPLPVLFQRANTLAVVVWNRVTEALGRGVDPVGFDV